MMNNEEFVDKLSQCDFFSGDRETFHRTVGKHSSTLVYGAHKDPAPLISIIVTTYKRPVWLKVTLDSVLGQEGFNDYEVIVVDNEGESQDVETETSRLVRSYHDGKIVYYRNFPTVLHVQPDVAVACSRSKYFCFVHDDDFIAKDLLKRMSEVLDKHPEISYLTCVHKSFDTNDEAEYWIQARENAEPIESLIFYPPKAACVGLWPGPVGALINRENYIDMGGMSPPVNTVIDDLIMNMKYMNRYGGAYRAVSEKPLYLARTSTSQGSSTGSGLWLNAYIAEYMFYKYCAKRYHPGFPGFWNYIASIIIHNKVKGLERQKTWLNGASYDRAALERLTGWPIRNGQGIRRFVGKRLLSLISRHSTLKSSV